MKKTVILLISLIGLFSCSKQEFLSKSANQDLASSSKVNPNYLPGSCPYNCLDIRCKAYLNGYCGPTTPPDITATYAGVNISYEVSNQIFLRFNSVDNANKVLLQLETDYDTYNDNYDSQYPTYTADQLDNVDSINNFDQFKKIRDFENLFSGFSSKRKAIENTENAYISNNFIGVNPDTLDRSFDDFENAVFNNNYAFKIGTDLYELKSDGYYVNGVFQGVGGNNQLISTNGTVSPNAAPPCVAGRNSLFFTPPGTNRRYKLKAAIHSIGIRSSAKGKVVSFKPKGSGWKRARSEMAITAGGNIYTTQCVFNFQFSNRYPSPSGYKKRIQLKVDYRDYGAGGQTVYKTRPNEFAATFSLPSGYSAITYLQ